MKHPMLTTCMLLLLISSGIYSCRKKSSSDPLGTSAIIYVNYSNSNGNATYYRIVYGAANNVDSIISTGGGADTGNNGFLAFSYRNSSYLITDNNNNISTIDINTSLMPDTILTSGAANYSYLVYDGGQLQSLIDVATTPDRYNYNYTNNNISSVNYTVGGSATSSTETFDYNTGQKGQLGDPQRIQEFLSIGRAYTTSANLPTAAYQNGTLQQTYTYQLDGSGRITSMMIVYSNTGGVNDTARYGYVYNF